MISAKGGESRGGCRKVGPALERRCQERGFRPELLLECQQLVGSALLVCPRQLPRQASLSPAVCPPRVLDFSLFNLLYPRMPRWSPLSIRDSSQPVGPFLPNTDINYFIPVLNPTSPQLQTASAHSASGAEQRSTKLPPLPKTSEKDLGQLWFQSYNAWFKRGRKELITGMGDWGEKKKMRKS